MTTRPQEIAFDDTVLRSTGALALLGIALIHFLDFFSKLSETPYIAVLYAILMAVTVAVALRLVYRASDGTWMLAGLTATATIVAYVLSRTTGLPRSTADVGNWREPLGLASLFVEGTVVMMSATAIAFRHAVPGGRLVRDRDPRLASDADRHGPAVTRV